MVAVLAASCSSDMLKDDFAGIQQDNAQNLSAEINSVVTKALGPSSDLSVLDVADIYAQFAGIFMARDYMNIFSQQLSNVSSLVIDSTDITDIKGILSVDFTKVGGKYYEDEDWSYTPSNNGLQFEFYNSGNDNYLIKIGTDSTKYKELCQDIDYLSVKLPLYFEDTLFVNGSEACTGNMEIELPDTSGNLSTISIARWTENRGLRLTAGLSGDTYRYDTQFSAELFDPYDEDDHLTLEIIERADSCDEFALDFSNNNVGLRLAGSDDDLGDMLKCLAQNVKLASYGKNVPDSLYDAVNSMVYEFNLSNAMDFYYRNDDGDEYEGLVQLKLLAPDEVFGYYHVSVVLIYGENDGDLVVIEAPIEQVILKLRNIIKDFAHENISAAVREINSRLADSIRNLDEIISPRIAAFNAALRDYIGAMNEAISSRFGAFQEAINARISALEDILGPRIEDIREGFGRFLNFNGGLVQLYGEFWAGLDQYLDGFWAGLLDYIDSYRN